VALRPVIVAVPLGVWALLQRASAGTALAVQEVAFADDQLSVDEPPGAMVAGAAVKERVSAAGVSVVPHAVFV